MRSHQIQQNCNFCLNAQHLCAILSLMKDCTTCKHRVELNPQYADMEWGEIPCGSCEYVGPTKHHDSVQLTDRVMNHPNEKTWKITEKGIPETTLGGCALSLYLAMDEEERSAIRGLVGEFTARQEVDLGDLMLIGNETYQAQADRNGISRPAQWKRISRIKQKIRAVARDEAIG